MSENGLIQRDLSDGDWIELPPWLSHGQMKAVSRIINQSRKNENEMDIQTQMIEMLVKKWSLKDEDGNMIPINKAGIERVPQIKVSEVFNEVTRLVEAATPNN